MYKVLEWIMEAIGWLRIVISPLFIGLVVGAIVYGSNPSYITLVIGISIALIGLIIGVMWATKVWKTKGTMMFLSRISGAPELDNKEETPVEEKEDN